MSFDNPWHRPTTDQPWQGPPRIVATQPVGQHACGYGVPRSPGFGGAPSGGTTKPVRGSLLRVVGWVMTALVFSLCGLIAVAVIVGESGLLGAALGFVAALIPVAIVVASLRWVDRYENEPWQMLALAFVWGATVGVLVALLLNTTAAMIIEGQGGSETTAAVIVAPLVEEPVKAAGVVLILLLIKDRFDGIVDGIVYAGFSAMGFAFVEDILYFGRAYAEAGSEGLGFTLLARGLMSPFAHPMFTAMTGIGIGIAISTTNRAVKVFAPLTGLLVAMTLHGLWNYGAASDNLLIFYVFLMVPIFLAFVGFVVWARRREANLIQRHLITYATYGWLTPVDVSMLASPGNRRQAKDWALRTQGPDGKRAMEQFQDVASDLAFLRERIENGTARPQARAMEPMLLNTLWQLRSRFVH